MNTVRRFFSRILSPTATHSAPGRQARAADAPGDAGRAESAGNAESTEEPPAWIVVGLGNPGRKYEATRHNIGFMVLDQLAADHQTGLAPDPRLPGCTAGTQLAGQQVLLAQPRTFMNLSGEFVGPLMRRWNLPMQRLIVVHDELDLEVGRIRLRQGGSENGHNGLKSISAALGSRDYLRVRVGISRPPRGTSIPDYVLAPLETGELTNRAIDRAAAAIQLIVTSGLAKAQNSVHSC
ncbi:aminoacyl-tRNA hydrolase [Corynebacterium atypicum]|uniref:aminoacyl-tRNA hydrolase n=1 Tax=Corynebacterium atypicum TaxID=191610 RepID=UPI001EEEE4BA|nr:aminoacyl-tRNA hydrolase [Corynebacterium atypicum]